MRKLIFLAIFIMLEFGVLALLLRSYVLKKETYEWRVLFIVAVAFLVALPFFRYGLLNDFVMRGCIASLLILMILTVRYLTTLNLKLFTAHRNLYVYTGIIAVLVLGSINSLVEFNIHLRGTHHNTHFWSSIVSTDLPESDKVFAEQYLGNKNSTFFRTLAQR